MDLTTAIGGLAAFCTSAAYFPQLKKCWMTGETGDLSLTMFLVLFGGLALWVVYGLSKGDLVVVAANVVSLCLLSGILYFKLRELISQRDDTRTDFSPERPRRPIRSILGSARRPGRK